MEVPAAIGRNWVDLPEEIWNLIAKKIDGNKDFIVFGSVCKTWQLARASVKHPESPPKFPLLLLSDGTKVVEENTHEEEEELKNMVQKRTMYNIFTSTGFDINLPEAHGKKCFAVNFGWLLTLSKNEDIELLHPFSRRRIKLPNVRAFSTPHEYGAVCFGIQMFIGKAVISCSPDHKNNNCYVFITYHTDQLLAFTRVGDEYWTTIHTGIRKQVVDMIYKKEHGLLYALAWDGTIFVCDLKYEHPTAVSLTATPPPVEILGDTLIYLVELGDDLLLVRRVHYLDYVTREAFEEVKRLQEERRLTYQEVKDIYFPSKDETKSYRTTDFIMFKLEMDIDGRMARSDRWTRVEDLGNRALFLGDNASLCLESNEMISSNCVYFTDNYLLFYNDNSNGGGYDTGIMNLQDKSIQLGFTSSRSFYCTPFWYV